MADAYFPRGDRLPRIFLEALVEEAIIVSDDQYGVDAAVAWANNYFFPKEMFDSDVRCLQAAQLDFVTMVSCRLKSLSSDRLSSARVERLQP